VYGDYVVGVDGVGCWLGGLVGVYCRFFGCWFGVVLGLLWWCLFGIVLLLIWGFWYVVFGVLWK